VFKYFKIGGKNMTKKLLLILASSAGLLSLVGCSWLQGLYAAGSVGGVLEIVDFFMQFCST
jgi:hypothetical protein